MSLKKKLYTVWVGGGEINPNLLTYEEAKETAEHWGSKGYDDVVIEEVEE